MVMCLSLRNRTVANHSAAVEFDDDETRRVCGVSENEPACTAIKALHELVRWSDAVGTTWMPKSRLGNVGSKCVARFCKRQLLSEQTGRVREGKCVDGA